jgi:hypothetical protein
MKYPKGYPVRPGVIKLAISFPEELFKEVLQMAIKERRAFDNVLIELIKIGKFDLDESDSHEPTQGRKH